MYVWISRGVLRVLFSVSEQTKLRKNKPERGLKRTAGFWQNIASDLLLANTTTTTHWKHPENPNIFHPRKHKKINVYNGHIYDNNDYDFGIFAENGKG